MLLAGCGGGDAMQVPTGTATTGAITVQSSAFVEGATIPEAFTCRGAGGAPPLTWSGVPDGAASLALVVSDPDAPGGTWVHWVVYDLPPSDGGLPTAQVPSGAHEADNSGGSSGWAPPCPPSGTHHYLFTVHALDQPVSGASTQDLLDEIGRHAVTSGTLTGLVSADG
jgi:Raf kinase inhibitor-like YbhB/YbcL family protein